MFITSSENHAARIFLVAKKITLGAAVVLAVDGVAPTRAHDIVQASKFQRSSATRCRRWRATPGPRALRSAFAARLKVPQTYGAKSRRARIFVTHNFARSAADL